MNWRAAALWVLLCYGAESSSCEKIHAISCINRQVAAARAHALGWDGKEVGTLIARRSIATSPDHDISRQAGDRMRLAMEGSRP